jgi:hypothetical protein
MYNLDSRTILISSGLNCLSEFKPITRINLLPQIVKGKETSLREKRNSIQREKKLHSEEELYVKNYIYHDYIS